MIVCLLNSCSPIQNETQCSYYLRTGQCKFGSTCKFHHPQPTNMMVSLSGSPVYPTMQSPTTPGQQSYPGGISNWSRASFIPSPRWQGPSSYTPLLLPQGVLSVPGWNAYSVSFLLSLPQNMVQILYVCSGFSIYTIIGNLGGGKGKYRKGGRGGGRGVNYVISLGVLLIFMVNM